MMMMVQRKEIILVKLNLHVCLTGSRCPKKPRSLGSMKTGCHWRKTDCWDSAACAIQTRGVF